MALCDVTKLKMAVCDVTKMAVPSQGLVLERFSVIQLGYVFVALGFKRDGYKFNPS